MRHPAVALLTSLALFLTLNAAARGDSISLSYPLAPLGSGNPYTAPMTAILDHAGSSFQCAGVDQEIVAYSGEQAGSEFGDASSFGATACNPDVNSLKNRHRYGQNDKVPSDPSYPPGDFLVTGSYSGFSSSLLSYDGHAGYDYDCEIGDAIYPAAPGTFVIPTSDDINGPPSNFNTFKIEHSDNWETWYLHASELLVDSGVKVNATTAVDGHPQGAVALCGDEGTVGSHLHFEVRRNVSGQWKVVDPYGWEWGAIEADPFEYSTQAAVQNEPLWGVLRPQISDVQLTETSAGSGIFDAVIDGSGFVAGALVTIWDKAGRFSVCHFGVGGNCFVVPDLVTATRIEATLPLAQPELFAVKIKNPLGPRSLAWDLGAGTGETVSVPFLLAGDPAPGGGTFASIQIFDDANDTGIVVFEANVDFDGDGIGEEPVTYQYVGGALREVSVPGIAKVGRALINDKGDMAFGDASVPGRTQAMYFLEAGSSTPIKVVEWDDVSPVNEWTYFDPRGPLGMNEDGEFTFVSGLYDASTDTGTCCYFFLYSPSTDTVDDIVGDGYSSPVGGTFDIFITSGGGFTESGDFVFPARVNGGAANAGIFRYSRATDSFSKVVADRDPAPSSVGGTFIGNGLFLGPQGVAGDGLAFVGDLRDAAVEHAVFQIKDVEADTVADIVVVAAPGQATGTSVGGAFSDTTGRPFAQEYPAIRRDGGVIFHSRLESAFTDTGLPTFNGVFLWTGREFVKIAVDDEFLPDGRQITGVRSFISNDVGKIYYGVHEVQ